MKIDRKEQTVHQRFDQMITSLEISKNAFAQRLGIASTQIYNITASKNSPSHEMYVKIAVAFPKINLGWLIAGVGSIYSDNTTSQAVNDSATFMEMIKKMEAQLELISEYIQTDQERVIGEQVLSYLEKLTKVKNGHEAHLKDGKMLEGAKRQR